MPHQGGSEEFWLGRPRGRPNMLFQKHKLSKLYPPTYPTSPRPKIALQSVFQALQHHTWLEEHWQQLSVLQSRPLEGMCCYQYHGPQPCCSQAGFGIFGAIHSPSSSSSQYSGLTASGSGMYASASSSQSSGLTAFGSGIKYGASSSQSSGLTALGSGISSSSTQSAGFSSLGSSISFGGVRSKYLESNSEPAFATSPLILISKSWLGLIINV
ncbi:hypothetical protein OGATHE_002967 [Ogataea polymorpha]|uniref:Uncharacterized protein n=1 Tax=Ogataea polymorpha TaxID=460523 RepID=A0A9P8PF91_9ASCO|nr:hypothetical protein OGATHE_002967 [Ogataea polymorpha]